MVLTQVTKPLNATSNHFLYLLQRLQPLLSNSQSYLSRREKTWLKLADLMKFLVVWITSLACLDHLHGGSLELIIDVDVALGSGNAFVPCEAG